jgi:hypothetical protein
MMKTITLTWACLLLPVALGAIGLLYAQSHTANAAPGAATTVNAGFREEVGRQTTDDGQGMINGDGDDEDLFTYLSTPKTNAV